MAEKKTQTKAEGSEEVTVSTEPNPYERVPYELEINWENPESDKYVHVSYGDYTATIERGKTVMIPRFVAQNLDQQKADEKAAKLERIRMQEEFRKVQMMLN